MIECFTELIEPSLCIECLHTLQKVLLKTQVPFKNDLMCEMLS